MKEYLSKDLTEKEIEVAQRAAVRWGCTDHPSFGDIIDELTPDYRCKGEGSRGHGVNANNVACQDREQIARWHRVKNYAYTLVPEAQRDARPIYRRTPSDPSQPSYKRKTLCPVCRINYMTANAKTCRPCRTYKASVCARDGCDEPCSKQRKYCGRDCHRLATKAAPMAQCRRDGCEEIVNTRAAKWCSQKCSKSDLANTTVERDCYKCAEPFVTGYSSTQRFCASCRGAKTKTAIARWHNYGLKHEKLPRTLG